MRFTALEMHAEKTPILPTALGDALQVGIASLGGLLGQGPSLSSSTLTRRGFLPNNKALQLPWEAAATRVSMLRI